MSKDRYLMGIDMCGGLLIAGMIWGVGWYVIIKPDTASSLADTLSAEVRQLRSDFASLEAALDTEEAAHRETLASVEHLGRLPSKSPIDEDLKHITSLANANQVKVREVLPTSRVRYPYVLEMRYSLKAEGAFQDQVRFLEAFEQCKFWADVTHMRIAEAPSDRNASTTGQQSELTVSFFSALQ